MHSETRYARRQDKGFALVWSLFALIGLTVIAVAGYAITKADRLITTNFETESRSYYLADGGMSEYFAEYAPLGAPDSEVYIWKEPPDSVPGQGQGQGQGQGAGWGVGGEDGEGTIDTVLAEFHGSDLKTRQFDHANDVVIVRPVKVAAGFPGDIYLLTGDAQLTEGKHLFPRADRTLRTFAQQLPPFNLLATLTAPNGFIATKDAGHLHLDGKAKGKCGAGNIPALATPLGTSDLKSDKKHLKSEEPYKQDPWDDSWADVQTELEALRADWPALSDPASYADKENFVHVPGDVPSLDQVTFKDWKKKKDPWPIIFHQGTVNLASPSPTKVKGHGLLVITDSLIVGKEKLDWKGIILVGRALHLTADEGHMHAKGAVVTGLACTEAEIAAGDCTNLFEGKHMDIKYHACEVEAAWSQAMLLAPLGRTRHTVVR